MKKLILGLIATALIGSPAFAQGLSNDDINYLSNVIYKKDVNERTNRPLITGLQSNFFVKSKVSSLSKLNFFQVNETIWKDGLKSFAIPFVQSDKTLIVSILNNNYSNILDTAIVDNNVIIRKDDVKTGSKVRPDNQLKKDDGKIGNRIISVTRPDNELLQDVISQTPTDGEKSCFKTCFDVTGDKFKQTIAGTTLWYTNSHLAIGAAAECGIRCSTVSTSGNPLLPELSADDSVLKDLIKEGLVLAKSARTAVTENAANGASFASGWTPPSATDHVASVAINPVNGEITIIYTEKVLPADANTLILSPRSGGPMGDNLKSGTPPQTSQITWNCNAVDQDSSTHLGNKGTISSKYLLANCPEVAEYLSETDMIKAHVTQGLALASFAKTAVAENASNGSPFISGWTPPSATDDVASIGINPVNGAITITYTDRVALPPANKLILVPRDGANPLVSSQPPVSGSINWYCLSSSSVNKFGTTPTISGNLVPANCR